MSKYKFDRFHHDRCFSFFFVIPTIEVVINEQYLMEKNLSIRLNWLGFHLGWRWIKEKQN